jgi:hypothetical protein
MTPEEQNLDMLVAELDRENRLLRARNERLEREAEQRKPWVGLTEEETAAIVREAARGAAIRRDGSTSERIAQAIEAKLREKNQ